MDNVQSYNLITGGVDISGSWFGDYSQWGENKITGNGAYINSGRASDRFFLPSSPFPIIPPDYDSPYDPAVCIFLFN